MMGALQLLQISMFILHSNVDWKSNVQNAAFTVTLMGGAEWGFKVIAYSALLGANFQGCGETIVFQVTSYIKSMQILYITVQML